ncbi:hypothetical protein Daus18300_005888 [Diaporthe australafricana]|uniref:Uncharacterized protein n=1 Tax=Diaporthe australafricana TaxID=127596 RepID=A0ABR3WYJ0_9PEZI
MPDDGEPQGPSNPFIRFKNHVNARIGTGVSVFTGTTGNAQPSTHDRQSPADHHHDPDDIEFFSPCPARHLLGEPRRQSSDVHYWNDWCLADPYSPHNLRHLPQPTPRDLPPDVEPCDFGFHEAFEDLMSASRPSGGPLMYLRDRAREKETPRGGLDPSCWVKRLYDASLLPPPLLWERPGLARGMQVPQPARREQPERGLFDSPVAQAILESTRGTGDDPMSRMGEIVGRDVAEIMSRTRKVAEETFKAVCGEDFEDRASGNSRTQTHGDAKPASDNVQDQPSTEEDLFQMIHAASSGMNKLFSTFADSVATHASPPAEQSTREKSPASETVEYDGYGGKTVRTTSGYTDMFGFVHSKSEVNRLNARGETVGYDTRYSVLSSASAPRSDPARPEADTVRPNKLVPIMLTPAQTYAQVRKSSDEQLEALRAFTANADTAARLGQGLWDLQMQLIHLEQQHRRDLESDLGAGDVKPRVFPRGEESNLQDYPMQSRLLGEQNRRRQRAQEVEGEAKSKERATPGFEKPEFLRELELLEQQSQERLRMARECKAQAQPTPEKSREDTSSKPSGWFWR